MPAYSLLCTVPATVEPISLSEAKTYLRVDGAQDDGLIGGMIKAARQWVEEFTGNGVVNQRWQLETQETHPPEWIDLPTGPVTAIASVALVLASGGVQTLDTEHYELRAGTNRLYLKNIGLGARVRVIYDAGYGTAPYALPEPIRQALYRVLSGLYEGEPLQGDAPISAMVEALLVPYRQRRL